MNPLLLDGIALERQGRHEAAFRAYSAAIARGIDPVRARCLRAALLQKAGQLQHAVADYDAAALLDPANAAVWQNRGNALLSLGAAQQAIESLRRALSLDPTLDEARISLGAGLQIGGRADEAIDVYRTVLSRRPGHPAVCSNLATLLIDRGQNDEAARLCRLALATAPDFVNARFNLALALDRSGDAAAAATAYRAVLDAAPDHADALLNLGVLTMRAGDPQAALAALERAAALRPGWTLPRVNAALIHRDEGNAARADALLRDSLAAEPDNALALVAFAVAAIPVMPDTPAEREAGRAAFRDRLDRAREALAAAPPEAVEKAIGAIQPYFLAYHPDDNLALLSLHGDLCRAALARRDPPPRAARRTEGRVAVGIVSAHVRPHSVWDAITRGIVARIDSSRFAVTIFAPGMNPAAVDPLARARAEAVVTEPATLDGWIAAIRAAAPDVLVYPEIGMDQTTLQLAALRLAPRQVALWGHPETTGLPTIDAFLSAERFEPGDGDRFYRERLIRLPGAGSFYDPAPQAAEPFDLSALRGPEGAAILVCPGAAFKYQPDHDDWLVRIAQQAAPARLVFFHLRRRWISERLEQRLRRAFAAQGQDFDSTCVFLDWMKPGQFHGLLSGADLVLDTIGFSGFNTAMQTIEQGTPYLAFEGRHMRGRLASGLMDAMEIPGLVARTAEDFVGTAARLAHDAPARAALRATIEARRNRLFRDDAVIRAVEAALLSGHAEGPGWRG